MKNREYARLQCHIEGSVCFVQALTAATSEAHYERLFYLNNERGLVTTAVARLDNRIELAGSLDILPADLPGVPDGDLIHRAYIKWGENAPGRIYGDWCFAAWHPAERRLFLARDHFGNTSLYYYIDQRVCAFASSRQVLLDLNLAPIELDELYLAQVLISWQACQGERTIHSPIRRLPPAHTLTVIPGKCDTNQYWSLEETPLLHLPSRDDYVSAFLEVFDEAVQVRLRSVDGGDIAVSLSGGLDSGAVAVTAAALLRNEGRRLKAFTSVPLSDTSTSDGTCMGDEFPFAEATARFSGNIDLYPVNAASISPIQAIRRMLQITNEPAHAAGNFFWMLQLEQEVAARGGKVLLNGQMGNATISWPGDIFSQPLVFQLQHLGWRRWIRQKIKRAAPSMLLTAYRRQCLQKQEWCRSSAIHPDFADRLNLLERRLNDPEELLLMTALEQRVAFIQPGRSMTGALNAEMGAAYGLEVRDPTADVRLLVFTFSLPDHIFRDPASGQSRWLIREAMKGRLPEEVRLNRRFGRQAADRVLRLRACAGEVDATLDDLARGPAAAFVDVTHMRRVWQSILVENTQETFVKSGTILLRGIMAGLFVNGFYK